MKKLKILGNTEAIIFVFFIYLINKNILKFLKHSMESLLMLVRKYPPKWHF